MEPYSIGINSQNIELHTVILHSKITPERSQITQDHTRCPPNHFALCTYFLYWASLNNFSSLSHSPSQTEGNPHILQMTLRSLFFISKVKNHINGHK